MLWKYCHKGTAKVIHRKRWPAGRKDPEDDTLVFHNMLRELLRWIGYQSSEHMSWFNLFFRVYVVMVWLSKMGKYLSKDLLSFILPGMEEWEHGHHLRRDTHAILGIAFKFLGRNRVCERSSLCCWWGLEMDGGDVGGCQSAQAVPRHCLAGFLWPAMHPWQHRWRCLMASCCWG
jgi:hypothetical protein